jgi:membrane-bound serine protease (ClpP class)
VREAATLTSGSAQAENVIDFTATSIEDLLDKAHGMTVQVGLTEVELDTRGLAIEFVEQDWRTQLLAIITNPNVALIFMMVGVYGLIFEFMNPGTWCLARSAASASFSASMRLPCCRSAMPVSGFSCSALP